MAQISSHIRESVTRVAQLMTQHQLVLATAESCTGGGIAYALTGIPGSSQWFDRAFVTYSNQAKTEMLGVSAQLIDAQGAVSEAVVKAMASGAIQHSRAHLSVAVSGIAGPDGGTPEKPVGLVWFAWGQKLGYVEAEQQIFTGDRDSIRASAILFALQGIIRRMSA